MGTTKLSLLGVDIHLRIIESHKHAQQDRNKRMRDILYVFCHSNCNMQVNLLLGNVVKHGRLPVASLAVVFWCCGAAAAKKRPIR